MENNKPFTQQHFAAAPTDRTLFFRRFPPWQLIRFIVINLRMMRMIHICHNPPSDKQG